MSVAARLAVVMAAAGLLAGCFEPLYGRNPSLGDESVRDKLADVLIVIPQRQGSPQARMAVALRNALQYDFNGGAGAALPIHRLDVVVTTSNNITVSIDPVSGRPNEAVGSVTATYSLTEIATGKIVVKDSAFANAGYDIPGTQQRFAGQRAGLNAEDRAVNLVADAIRNRLASYFVAGT